jgi:hypothetical protein
MLDRAMRDFAMTIPTGFDVAVPYNVFTHRSSGVKT